MAKTRILMDIIYGMGLHNPDMCFVYHLDDHMLKSLSCVEIMVRALDVLNVHMSL